jgi:hypothetical protein
MNFPPRTMKMLRNEHKPGNMAVLVQAPGCTTNATTGVVTCS